MAKRLTKIGTALTTLVLRLELMSALRDTSYAQCFLL